MTDEEELEERRFCRHCWGEVEKINFSGFAGKGDPRPWKHRRPQQVPCTLTTLKDEDTTTDAPDFDYH